MYYCKNPKLVTKQFSSETGFNCKIIVCIDQHLTWHVKYILRTIRDKLYSINCLKPLTSTVMKLLYQAHVLPIIDYCDVVGVPTNFGHLKRLERLHSRFSSVDFASSSVFKLTLAERRRFHTATQILWPSCITRLNSVIYCRHSV